MAQTGDYRMEGTGDQGPGITGEVQPRSGERTWNAAEIGNDSKTRAAARAATHC